MNFKKLWSKRKSIIFTWLISYTAVVFIPIVMSLIIYQQSNIALRSEIHRANNSLLRQVRETIDTQIDLMKRLNMEVSWNTKLQDLMYSNKSDSEAQYTAYQAVQDYRMYQSSYSSIDEFYVTWDKEQTVLRPNNMRDFQSAFNTIHNTGAISYAEWLAKIENIPNNHFLVLPRMDAPDPKQSLAYITHLPPGNNGNPSGTVVIMSDTQRFLKAIENIQMFSGGQVYILNKNKEILISNTSQTLPQSILQQLNTGADGIINNGGKGGESEVFYISSGVSSLEIVSVIPSKLYWQKAEDVRRFMYISILISVLGAGALTLFFLRRNYSPIRRIVQSLSGNPEEGRQRTDGNELSFIQKAVTDTLSEKEKIHLELQQQNNMLRSNMLTRLLKGKLDGRIPLDDAFQAFDFRLQSDDFSVILFFIEDYEAVYSSFPAMESYERRRLLQFILTNVVEELAGQRNHFGYVAEVDDMLACIVNFSNKKPELRKEDMRWITSEAQHFLKERFNMELTLAIGSTHNTLAGVSQSYQEALDAMEYKMVLGKEEILSFDEIQNDILWGLQSGYYYPLQIEQQLINFIKVGDFEKSSLVLKEITERNFGKPLISLTLAKCLMFNLISTIIKTINELGGVENSFLMKNPHWMEQIVACDTIKEMQEEMLSLLYEVCSYAAAKLETNVARGRTESIRELAAEVNGFIQEQYGNINLNVGSIGGHFHMKPSYLSKLYKDQTGEGLLDVLNKIRIVKAKEMLQDKTVPISDVANQVGYSEPATFIRVFKRYEGITPGKYREMI